MITLTDKAKEKLKFFMKERNSEEWGVQIRNQGASNFHFSLIKIQPLDPNDLLLEVESFKFIVEKELSNKLIDAHIDFMQTAWSSGFKIELKKENNTSSYSKLDESIPQVKKIQKLLQEEINPAIADHGGFVELLSYKNNIVYLKMGGGCQGCASSQATLRQGIEARLREEVPEIVEVIDQTDHASGVNPYF